MLPIAASLRRGVGVALCLMALGGRPADVNAAPVVLTANDADTYRRVFALQDEGRWAEADALVPQIDDKTLMGYVLQQRYLDPKSGKANFAALQSWMAEYRDLPGAEKVHAAARRLGKGALSTPMMGQGIGFGGPRRGVDALALPRPTSGHGAKVWAKFRQAVDRDDAEAISRLLDEKSTLAALPLADRDRMRAGLAQILYYKGHDELALETASAVARRSGTRLLQAQWIAGLASWRLGKFDEAKQWFVEVAEASDDAPWLGAAGAYWSARTALRTRQPEEASRWLLQAAKYRGTFYGLVARRALGMPLGFNWNGNDLGEAEAVRLRASTAGARALALVQVGKTAQAEDELRRLYSVSDPETQDAITRLANVSGMAALSLTLAGLQGLDDESTVAAASYPIPSWQPDGGWSIDRALVFALARQESGFNPNARSPAGASGVMQVMPGTAAFVVRQTDLPTSAARNVMNPETNMALGQKYIEHLLLQPEIETNLFFVAAAYNAGPGNLIKWKASVRFDDDPLLFIESLPVQQTRNYIERVVANLWIYHDRLGQPTPSLDAVAGGRWPKYVAAERMTPQAAEVMP